MSRWQIAPLGEKSANDAAHLFFDTVHAACARDYTSDQLDAWAPDDAAFRSDLASKLLEQEAIGAFEAESLVGFGSLDAANDIDMLYVRSDRRGQGVGRTLVNELERMAAARGERSIETFASITARPFFEAIGYVCLHENRVVRRGVELANYRMEKQLGIDGEGSAPDASPAEQDNDRKLADNRANWNDRANVHAASSFYEVERLVGDPSFVSPVAQRDFETLAPHLRDGSLEGLSVLHLQCHIGTDTISWRRLGAREVWGLDFSPTSLEHAREIARRANESITYVQGDARFASRLISRTFDVVVTSIGTITWLPDLDDWARSAAELLSDDGVFLLRDDHPLLDALGYESLSVTEDYLSHTGSIDYESDESYTPGSSGTIEHTAVHNWRHDFQEILGSLIGAGLDIVDFRETPYAEWKALPFLVETDRGWALPDGAPRIPLTFSLVARKRARSGEKTETPGEQAAGGLRAPAGSGSPTPASPDAPEPPSSDGVAAPASSNGVAEPMLLDGAAAFASPDGTAAPDIVRLSDRPDLAERAASWFAEKWGIPASEYRESIGECNAGSAVPQWYVALGGDARQPTAGRPIVAGAGVIENDFHERRDLAPNVCAVFVEPSHRGRGISRALLARIRDDMASFGIERLYLLTDHDSYYEKLGWRFVGMVRDNEGALGRMYAIDVRQA